MKKSISILILSFFVNVPVKADNLISVIQKSKKPNLSTEQLCRLVHEAFNSVKTENTVCLNLNEVIEQKQITDERSTQKYTYHFHIRSYDHTLKIQIQHWKRSDNLEVAQTQFNILKDRKNKWQNAVALLAQNLMHYDLNKDAYKIDLLRNLITESKRISADTQGRFIDKISNQILTLPEAIAIYQTEYPDNRAKLTTAIEFGAIFGYFTYNYYQNHKNRLDWDYTFTEGLKLKIKGEAVRFDDNDRSVNTGHVTAGTGYYLVCRGNGFTALESFLCNVAASSVWEFLVEYKEVVSINDYFTTAIGGTYVGEVFHKFSCSLRTHPSKALRALGAIFDPFAEINYWASNKKTLSYTDCKGDNSFSIGAGLRDDDPVIHSSLESNTLDIPFSDTNQELKLLIPSVYQTKLMVDSEAGEHGLETLHFLTQMAYLAVYKQKFVVDAEGQRSGYQIIISPSGGTEILERRNDKDDFFVNVHVIGPRVQLSGFFKDREFRAVIEVYKDFALVNSYALDEFKRENSLEGLQSVIKKHAYYYSSGESYFGDLEFRGKKWAVGLHYRYTDLNVIKGYDRYRDQVTQDLFFEDIFEQRRFSVEYRATKKIGLEALIERERRSGFIEGGYSSKRSRDRVIGRIKFRF